LNYFREALGVDSPGEDGRETVGGLSVKWCLEKNSGTKKPAPPGIRRAGYFHAPDTELPLLSAEFSAAAASSPPASWHLGCPSQVAGPSTRASPDAIIIDSTHFYLCQYFSKGSIIFPLGAELLKGKKNEKKARCS